MFDRFWQDILYGLRTARKNPGFTLMAVLTLALGIGANTAIFTVANALLLQPMPYPRPERLVLVATFQQGTVYSRGGFSFPRYQFITERSRSFSSMAAFTGEVFNITGQGEPEQLPSARVSANFFDVLGVQPELGRAFQPSEDQPGGPDAVLISHGLWTRRFAANPGVIGQSITLDSRPYAIICVMPPGFQFAYLGSQVDLWAPKVFELNFGTRQWVQAGAMFVQSVARLPDRGTREQAQAEMEILNQQYRREHAGLADANPKLSIAVDDLREQVVGDVRPAILILFGAVGLVLLIACANAAGLLLSRAISRRKEIAVRAALGASRGRVVQQLLTETLLVSLAAGLLGILFSAWAVKALVPLASAYLPRAGEIHMDALVLAFGVALSVLTGLFSGVMPSWQISAVDLNTGLREETRGSSGGTSKNRLRSALVISQVALSLALLIGSGLLIRSFAQLLNTGPGLDPHNLLTLHINLPTTKYPTVPLPTAGSTLQDLRMVNFYTQLAQHAAELPGVSSAVVCSALPVNPTRLTPMLFEGQPIVPLAQRPMVAIQTTTPDYFSTMHTPLIQGRSFTSHDEANSPRVAIVNQTLARRFWPQENPIGKHAYLSRDRLPVEIVGLAGDVKNVTPAGPPLPEMYLPYPQLPTRGMNLVIRTSGDPHTLIAAARHRIAALDPDLPVTAVQTMDEVLAGSRLQPRFLMVLLSAFAATALILAAVGLYGAISYSVAQRTHEVGIRMALGASRNHILAMVIRQSLALTGIGLCLGLAVAVVLTRLLKSLVFQISVTDPVTYVVSAVLFTVIALVASYLPAQRATRVDAAIALRSS